MGSFINNGFDHLDTLIHSIRFRLALWFVFILGIVIILFSSFIYLGQVRNLRAAASTRLELKVQRLANFFTAANREYFEPVPMQIPNDPTSGESFLQEGDVLAFMNTSGVIVQRWGPVGANSLGQWVVQGLKSNNLSRPFLGTLHTTRLPVQNTRVNYLMSVVPISEEGHLIGYFFIGTPIDPDHQLPSLLFFLSVGIIITLLSALVGGFWLADRAISPVKQITETARTLSETDLNRRLRLNSKDELGELADTFDQMLARLQAAFERQRQFTADASHELRTPLTIVELETSRALAARRSIPEYEQTLKVIKSENQFMIRLVNNLLTLARMDAGQIVLQKEPLDLSDIALEVVERLAPIANKSQVRLAAGELPELPIEGDRQYLTQMITNLVENAIKYTDGGDKRVEITTGMRQTQGGNQAWVRVSDNGPGIPAEHIPHLFDRFYQVDQARSRQESELEPPDGQVTSGAGLGLSIAQWVANAHGGEIRVESQLRKGTTFEVILPLAAVPEARKAPVAS